MKLTFFGWYCAIHVPSVACETTYSNPPSSVTLAPVNGSPSRVNPPPSTGTKVTTTISLLVAEVTFTVSVCPNAAALAPSNSATESAS